MEKFKLAFGLHNHQPIGNFDQVFDEAHNMAYQPFLELLDSYRKIRLSLHQSGILWNWQENKYPDYLQKVKRLVGEGRIEILTGGYYEPILPAIPDRDKLGQIELLNKYIEERFGQSPKGLWLTERVWEPHLPKVLNQAGVEYLPLDDGHFVAAGFEPEQLTGPFVTEEGGAPVRLLPIQKKLRYMIPFFEVDRIIEYLRLMSEHNPGGTAVYADDGEKFGIWPKTHQHCYKDGWLDKFFAALEENSDWLEVIPLGEAAKANPVGTAYLQSGSYPEMLQWSLPTRAFVEYEDFEQWLNGHGMLEKFGRFVRGGHWRGFLHKYPEANLMHKRMIAVSKKFEKYMIDHPGKDEKLEEIRDSLYAGQCNCPYWHGVFGGLYLPHLRQAIFANLIKAESLMNAGDDKYIRKEICDYNTDGHDEILLTTNKFFAVINPARGGTLLEIDTYNPPFNLSDTLSRRREGYHRKLSQAVVEGERGGVNQIVAKEKGLEKYLTDDWYLRRGFVDHLLAPETDIDDFLSGKFRDEGDFVLEPYSFKQTSDPGTAALKRRGHLWRDGKGHEIEIDKRFYFAPNSDVFSVSYAVTAINEDLTGVTLAVENNFNFQAGHTDDRYFLFDGEKIKGGFLDSTIAKRNCYSVVMRDDWRDLVVAITVDKTDEIWQVPIFTISQSEGGFEKVYQGTSVVHLFRPMLTRGVPFELTFLVFAGKHHLMPPRFARASDIRLTGA